MKHRYTLKFSYAPNAHLSQLYAGFEELAAKGVVRLEIHHRASVSQPVLEVIVNDRAKVVYDLMDGYNYINGTKDETLSYFLTRYNDADFVFKRSFDALFSAGHMNNVRPLGLNYPINVKYLDQTHVRSRAGSMFRKLLIRSGLTRNTPVYAEHFEFRPVMNKQNRILFQTRLWDPALSSNEKDRYYRNTINAKRIECIRVCKKEFGSLFTGGITPDYYAHALVPELLVPKEHSSKAKYLQTIKQHNICIATTGLHGSTGWKMGEYVTAARAIISEPLNYGLPGDFGDGKNYISFNDTDELVTAVKKLSDDKSAMQEMMDNNFRYYQSYLQPGKLILNTLEQLSANGCI